MKTWAFALLLLLLTFLSPSISTDTISQAAPITDNQTLVSAGGVFELGFFSPGTPDTRYLGIWYANIPGPRTVVWVANPVNLLLKPPGALKLAADGRLLILDGQNNNVWSSSTGKGTTSATAKLQDDGNFVVISGGSIIWQSFDYPTDTLLPGMKLGVNLKTGLARHITSWKSPTDPSPGEYTFKLVQGGLPEYILYRGKKKIYTSGPWNGAEFTGVPNLRSQDFSFKFVMNSDEVYYGYSINNKSLLTRFVVSDTPGQLQRYVWINEAWFLFWYYPTDPCDAYAKCGPFGYCDINQSPLCSCLPGFVPRFQQQWTLRDTSSGCIRRTNLSCRSDDGFWVMNRMKLPEAKSANLYKGRTLDECRQICLNNCSCRAYASANVGPGGAGDCVIWGIDLTDMRQYSEVVQDLYIRLAASEISALNSAVSSATRRPSKNGVLIAIVVTISGVLLLGAVGCCVWRSMVRRRRIEMESFQAGSGNEPSPFRETNPTAPSQPREQWLYENRRSAEKDMDLPLFDLMVILVATENFGAHKKIGEGGFGPVYMGRLEDGQEVAVKRLSRRSVQGIGEFKNEVKLIAKLQHRNLVRLLGCCINDDERILVYEYMHNQSLDTFLFNEGKRTLLGWRKRFEIILGIARGLLYLHQDSRFRIIHRDLKASNVLLDRNMTPKISDFGIARMFGVDQTTEYTKKVIGTYGYMSPEYAMDGVFSMKSDVYSFGVLVLEIVSGQRNRGFFEPELELSLLNYAWILWKEGRSMELVDKTMGGSCDYSEVLRCIQVALLCVEAQPRNRPLMSPVVMMLASENAATLPKPNEPGLSVVKNISDSESSQSLTANNVTITAVEAR